MVRLNPRSFRVVETESATGAMRSVEGPDHVGAFLREARENLGKPLAEIAQTLRIRRPYLEAIEDGRFSELPGATYAVGFVRSYAQFLRLDSASLVERFKQEAAGIETSLHLHFPTPLPEGRFPGGAVVAFCLILAIGIFAGWYWYQSQKALEVVQVPEPPAAPAAGPERFLPSPGDVAGAAAREESPPAEGAAPLAMASAGAEGPRGEIDALPAPGRSEPGAAGGATAEVADSTLAGVTPGPVDATAGEVSAMPVDTAADPAQPAAEFILPEAEAAPAEPATVGEATTGQGVADGFASDAPTSAHAPDEGEAAPAAGEGAVDDSVEISALPAPGAAPAEPAAATSSPTPDATAPDAEVDAPAVLPAVPALPAPSEDDSRVYGVVNQDARIVLEARSTSWVQVRDAASNVLLTQMLHPGDRYYVPNRSGLTLHTGNAGGLAISVDGNPVPPIGGEGAVLRNVRLEAEPLRAGTATGQ